MFHQTRYINSYGFTVALVIQDVHSDTALSNTSLHWLPRSELMPPTAIQRPIVQLINHCKRQSYLLGRDDSRAERTLIHGFNPLTG